MHIERGHRIGKNAKLSVSASAVIYWLDGILLIQRTDNGRYCLPGGQVELGESLKEAVIREVEEETSLIVSVERIAGVSSDPDMVICYPDGNKWQTVELDFVCRIDGYLPNTTPGVSNESTKAVWATLENIDSFDVMESELPRILSYLEGETFLG